MAENIRVRLAPSQTGPLHLGWLITALFNYLFAKQGGGTFIIRIVDTDKKRKVDGAEEYIISALKWCGISADESVVAGGDAGPYRQSERNRLYKKHVQTLIDKGLAYYAFDSEEALDQHREDHQKKGGNIYI